MKPIRIQRERTKGWKMPPNTIYAGRPTILGNPFIGPNAAVAFRAFSRMIMQGHETARALLLLYDQMGYIPVVPGMIAVLSDMYYPEKFRKAIGAARGKNLACFCPIDRPCHADVLLDIANS